MLNTAATATNAVIAMALMVALDRIVRFSLTVMIVLLYPEPLLVRFAVVRSVALNALPEQIAFMVIVVKRGSGKV